MKSLPMFTAQDCTLDALGQRRPTHFADNKDYCKIQNCPYEKDLNKQAPCCSQCEHVMTCEVACTISRRWRGKIFQTEVTEFLRPDLAYDAREICRLFNYPDEFIKEELNTMESDKTIEVRVIKGKKWYRVILTN